MRRRERLALLSALAWLTGCATSSLDLAPAAPNVPWTPPTSSAGAILAGKPAAASAPKSDGYVLPANATAAGELAPPANLDKSHPYTLAELIDLAQSHDPSTRVAWESARDAALATGIAKTAYLPQLTATATLKQR